MKILYKNPKLNNIVIVFLGLLIAVLGYFLRLNKFYFFPPVNDTYDELKAVFNGINLIKTGTPRSWSWYEPYGKFPIVHIRNADYRIVEPWFDEPPLFALIIGSYAISKGMDSLEKIDSGALRWPMIKLATVNILLLFVLVYMLAGVWEAALSALIFATEPTMVLGSRLPISENMIVTTSLLSLILFTFYVRKKNKSFLIVSGIIAASAFLMKPTGIFVPVSIAILAISLKLFKDAVYIFFCALFSIVIWFLFGFHYNFQLFLTLNTLYSGRELFVPSSINNLFEVFRIAETAMNPDGWLVWGWISVIAYSVFKKEGKNVLERLTLPVAIGSYLVVFAVMSGHSKGWYRYPFYPFLSWASAAFLIEIIKNPRFLLSLFTIGVPFFTSYISGNGERHWNNQEIKIYQFLFPLSLAPSLLYEIFQSKKFKIVAQTVLIVAVILALFLNVQTILYHQDEFWY